MPTGKLKMWNAERAVRDQHSGVRFLPCQARRDPDARYLRQRDSRHGLSRLGLGRASFVTFAPSLTSVPHEACRRTKNLQRELKHPAIFPKRCAVFVVTSPTCDDSRLIAGDLDIRSQATDFARLHFCVKTETQQSIEIAGFLVSILVAGTCNHLKLLFEAAA